MMEEDTPPCAHPLPTVSMTLVEPNLASTFNCSACFQASLIVVWATLASLLPLEWSPWRCGSTPLILPRMLLPQFPLFPAASLPYKYVAGVQRPNYQHSVLQVSIHQPLQLLNDEEGQTDRPEILNGCVARFLCFQKTILTSFRARGTCAKTILAL